MKYIDLEDTVSFYFGLNDVSGNGADGTGGKFYINDTSDDGTAAPVLTGNVTPLSEAGFPDGCYRVDIPATDANGFAAGKTYGVFVDIEVGIITPTAHIGDFTLAPVKAKLNADGLDLVMVDGKALPVAMQYIAAGIAGNLSGAGSGTELFKGIDGATDRISSAVDASGNRVITYDPVVVAMFESTPQPKRIRNSEPLRIK